MGHFIWTFSSIFCSVYSTQGPGSYPRGSEAQVEGHLKQGDTERNLTHTHTLDFCLCTKGNQTPNPGDFPYDRA